MKELLFLIDAFIAGVVQNLTGFGSGIILMFVLSEICSLNSAVGISGLINLFLNLLMFKNNYQKIAYKKIIFPLAIYTIISTICMAYSKYLDQILAKKILGIFFIMLSLYLLFFNEKFKVNKLGQIILMFLAGICGGFFGISGPLVVYYFLDICQSKEEYKMSISLFFLIQNIYSTSYRFLTGLLTLNDLSLSLYGLLGIVLGFIISQSFVSKADYSLMKKITYFLILISGILNLLT